jgi:hypothetical protein
MMKKRNIPRYYAVLLLTGLLLSGCRQFLLEKPEQQSLPEGMGMLSVSFSEAGQSAAASARTMLAVDPEFTGYELYISTNSEGSSPEVYTSSTGSFQITLPEGTYYVSAAGYTGDKVTARTWNSTTKEIAYEPVTINAGSQVDIPLTLNPYMDETIYGTLQYSLNWAVNQIPAQAELLVEQSDSGGNWNPIPISYINESSTAGHRQGTILLIQRETGLVQQSGYLELPPGEYKLTASVTMDGPNPPVSRTDIAHVFSNLITPAAFFYGSGDLTVTSSGIDGGSGFITRFNFAQTPGAVSIVGSSAGPDGTRLIMVMVPPGTNLTHLTPVVECAEGAFIASPPPLPDPGPDGKPMWDTGDYSRPTSWTAEGRNGVTQQYTVVVTEAAVGDCLITDIAFWETSLVSAPAIDQTAGTITVVVPSGTLAAHPDYELTPVFSYVGTEVKLANDTNPANDTPLSGNPVKFGTSASLNFRVYAQDGGTTKLYTVKILEGPNADTGIFDFVITNVPRAKVVIGTRPRADGKIPIIVSVPYATSPLTDDKSRTDLMKLIPRITLSSSTSSVDPVADGSASHYIPFGNQNDYKEAVYKVTAQYGNTQDYVVIVARDVPYYYVSASGNDRDPDYYNGSEQAPFKTLAYAVYQAVSHNVDHIYVIGTLNDASEGGAWEDTSATTMGNIGTFQPSGASPVAGGNSVFNLNGTGVDGTSPWPIYITGIGSNAILQGASGKRVLSVTGGARIIFDNITIQGGGGTVYTGNGGGIYAGGGSHITWKSGVISDSRAKSGGGVYVDNSEFDFMTGSIRNNTSAGSVTPTGFTQNSPSLVIDGGGGVYVNGDGQLWLANGEIVNNTASGSGGGVLVNGSVVPNNPTDDTMPHNFIMSGGSVNGNGSSGAVWPHGGGGVFVAKGSFEMMNGRITNNTSRRQGGGVFIWSKALFYMDGDSSVTANSGVGSAKAICTRGITILRGRAQADKSYIWNYAKGSWNKGVGDEFTLMEGARVSELALAFADDPQDNRNYINIVLSDRDSQFFSAGTDPITTVDLESHLNANGSFSTTATISGDWLGKYLIKNGGNVIPQAVVQRFPLGSFTYGSGSPSVSASFRLDTTGKLAAK